MRVKFWLAALFAFPLIVGALIHGRCHHSSSAAATPYESDQSECCSSDKSLCCLHPDKEDAPTKKTVQGMEPDKQIVFKVEGLRCPAVKGIGCGHLLQPVLASLDKLDGVEASATNYTGTMLRVSVINANDRAKVAEKVRKVLADNKPVALAGEDLKLAVEKEQWRETRRVGELSAIEFRTLALYQIKTFAHAEKLDKGTAAKLTQLAEDHLQRLLQEARKEKGILPEELGNRCKKSIPAFLTQARKVLNDEQLERFRKMLFTPCRGEDRPEAPPASGQL